MKNSTESLLSFALYTWRCRLRIVVLLVGITCLSACQSGFQSQVLLNPPAMSKTRTVLVAPPIEMSGHPNASQAVADAVSAKLRAIGGFEVKEWSWLTTQLRTRGGRVPDSRDYSTLAELGRRVGVDAVLAGVIYEYGFAQEYNAASPFAIVSLRLDMLLPDDGQIIWTSSTASSHGSALSANRPSISVAVVDAVDQALSLITEAIQRKGERK